MREEKEAVVDHSVLIHPNSTPMTLPNSVHGCMAVCLSKNFQGIATREKLWYASIAARNITIGRKHK